MSVRPRRRRRLAAAAAGVVSALACAPASGEAASVAHHMFFESPSRNIGCVILYATARCDIIRRAWTPPPRPSSCPSVVDFGQGLLVSRSGRARFVCAGDTALDPSAPILRYGAVDAVGALECSSAPTGVTCRSTRSGHGFSISRQRYSLF